MDYTVGELNHHSKVVFTGIGYPIREPRAVMTKPISRGYLKSLHSVGVVWSFRGHSMRTILWS